MLEIFQYDFMVRAFLGGLIIAVIAPFIGSFLVVRGYSLMADTLAHVSLAGVAIGLLTQTYPVMTAILASILAVLFMEILRQKKHVTGESLLALFLSGSLAIAVVIISIAKGFNVNFFGYLFGNIATVTSQDLILMGSLGIVVLLTIILFFKEFYLVAFDEELAQASGLPVKRLNLTQMLLAAIIISISIRIVGVLLIGALMVIPVLTSMALKRSFKQTVFFSILFSLISVICGLIFSYYFDLASGGTIVLFALILFLITSLIKSFR